MGLPEVERPLPWATARVRRLRNTQLEALAALAEGMTLQDYAAEAGIGYHAARNRVRRARNCLGAVTNEHAVAIYVREVEYDGVKKNGGVSKPADGEPESSAA